MRIFARAAAGTAIAVTVAVGGAAATAASADAATARPAASVAVPAGASGPVIRSHYAELANAANGADLWSRSSYVERPMGSITKVMTAYLVITAGHLNRVITVPSGIIAYDTKYEASTAGLVPGEKLTALQLLYAMMLPSGCDAAYTLANAYGPGRPAFIRAMNAAAKKHGLTRTHFSDFSGLPDPGPYTNYSTAHDLIALGIDAMKLPLFRQIVAARSYHVSAGSGHNAHTWKNSNPLLGKYPGVIGIKPGFTNAAGICLLFEARRGNRTLIGVVLHSAATANVGAVVGDAETMLNWGFSH